jgi:glycosyltransferase involved in cell wall biosynthesis
MTRPRICMLVHGPYPIGQPPRVVRAIGAATQAGFAVDVIASRRPGELDRETIDDVHVTRLPVVHRRGIGPLAMFVEYGGFTLLAAAILAWRTLRRRYAVVHVNNPPDFLIAAAVVPKLFGTRIVFDVHDLAPDMFAMRFPSGGLLARTADKILRTIERLAGAVADAVVTVHQPYREELISRGFRGDKIEVVMNAVDEAVLPPLSAPASEFRIVYHGAVTPHYGLDLLVAALPRIRASVPSAHVEIYGEGDAVPALREQARELGVSDHVAIAEGFLPHREVLEAVAGASVGVVPNRPIGLNRFALSTKLFEYCALEVPVVAAALPTLQAHFTEDELLFFLPGSADALADALIETACDPEAARCRAVAARARLADYRWDLSRERYVRVLRGLVAA